MKASQSGRLQRQSSSMGYEDQTDEDYEADVCLILEGSYPYVFGGVSGWTQSLIKMQQHRTFSVVSILPDNKNLQSRYPPPSNLVALHHLFLDRQKKKGKAVPMETAKALSEALLATIQNGRVCDLRALVELLETAHAEHTLDDVMNSPMGWQMVRSMYRASMPQCSFLQYFWAWRSLVGALLAVLQFPLPKARIYHSLSTGYAGILAARAAIELNRPCMVTEHGIYTNERRIEILTADWIADSVDNGFSTSTQKRDVRDMWIGTFENLARICYGASDQIIALTQVSQREQLASGADPARCMIISNGVDVERFSRPAESVGEPTEMIALIGRVVPIKDVLTFIQAVDLLRFEFPHLQAHIVGPFDEDPDYYATCRALLDELGLDAHVCFTGVVKIEEKLQSCSLVVLTSISEGQPLVMMEAGAAGIPCVATDVGGCREILFGTDTENPNLGSGGLITGLVSPNETADAIATLLRDPVLRKRLGSNLQNRIRQHYNARMVDTAYTQLYDRFASNDRNSSTFPDHEVEPSPA
ncbi:MAG: GT4 family glycosyltransferase PelF [Rhizobiaceae bacterium]|nr:GT4 family glycosyltransferase PelF [Rhizobiaceae bacterium]